MHGRKSVWSGFVIVMDSEVAVGYLQKMARNSIMIGVPADSRHVRYVIPSS